MAGSCVGSRLCRWRNGFKAMWTAFDHREAASAGTRPVERAPADPEEGRNKGPG